MMSDETKKLLREIVNVQANEDLDSAAARIKNREMIVDTLVRSNVTPTFATVEAALVNHIRANPNSARTPDEHRAYRNANPQPRKPPREEIWKAMSPVQKMAYAAGMAAPKAPTDIAEQLRGLSAEQRLAWINEQTDTQRKAKN